MVVRILVVDLVDGYRSVYHLGLDDFLLDQGLNYFVDVTESYLVNNAHSEGKGHTP